MNHPESTCWTVIEGAAAGSAADREQFARRYEPVITAYLSARWRGSARRLGDLDDAVQEVFVECFRGRGVLERAQRERTGGFRPFLYGVARNVALRFETRRMRDGASPPNAQELEEIASDETSLSRVFDRSWARTLLKEAAERQAMQAHQAGEAAQRRVELLRLRFHEGLSIRGIAARWKADAAVLHHEYAKARQEFKGALREVVAFHDPSARENIELECANLLALLG